MIIERKAVIPKSSEIIGTNRDESGRIGTSREESQPIGRVFDASEIPSSRSMISRASFAFSHLIWK